MNSEIVYVSRPQRDLKRIMRRARNVNLLLAQPEPLADDCIELAKLLSAQTFAAPDDVIAFVDEKCGGEIADAELRPNRTGVLVAAQEDSIVDPISLPGSADFQDLILGRGITFVINADHFQSISPVSILQPVQVFHGDQAV